MVSEGKTDFPYRWDMKRYHGNPVLRPVPGTWEVEWFGVATVIQINGKFYMYYRGSDVGNKNTQLGLAFSKDGFTWTRYKENPVWRLGNWEYFLRDARVYQFGQWPSFFAGSMQPVVPPCGKRPSPVLNPL